MYNRPDNATLLNKWGELLEEPSFPKIMSQEKKIATALMLENTENTQNAGESLLGPLMEAAPQNNTGGVQNYDPVLINLVRRAAPKLIAYDIMGLQPLSGPTGQIFALRSRYANQAGQEAFYGEANTGWTSVRGGNTQIVGDATLNVGTVPTGNAQTYNFAAGMSLAQGEALGTSGNVAWREMAISIEKVLVAAETRKLKAEYTHEFAQDLKAIHRLDAAKELSNVLSTEIIAEINRQLVRSVYVTAVQGAPAGRVQTAGTINLDVDTNGRWSAERFVGLHFHLDLEGNDIAKRTRRGKANILIVSSNVASALRMAKVLDVNDAAALQIDDTGNTYIGNVGGLRCYIDPYATSDFAVLGYKGANSWDAGIFYCPYTPIQQIRANNQDSLTPIIGMQTRAGIVANPFSGGANASDGKLVQNSNVYYSRIAITNLI